MENTEYEQPRLLPEPPLPRRLFKHVTTWGDTTTYMLSDNDISERIRTKRLTIEPFRHQQLNPASYDVRIGNLFRLPQFSYELYIDLGNLNNQHEWTEIDADNSGIYLPPLKMALATTIEKIGIPPDLAAKFEGKSTLGRLGLMTHVTAGFIDPGFGWQLAGDKPRPRELTIELFNASPNVLFIPPGIRIGQIAFSELLTPANKPYYLKGHYANQAGPTPANKEIDLLS